MPLAYSYIRFSTKEQAKGHSLKRQIEDREKYLAKRPDLTLDTSLTLEDLGKSAFKGANADEGNLGTFTHHYVEADLDMKERPLAKLHEPDAKIQRYRAPDSLLDFLKSL